MMLIVESPESLKDLTGKEIGVTDWVRITQERITQFADSTGDQQWIHVDRERAARESPYGTTIAHGFLTLSLLSQFVRQTIEIRGFRMAVNYGLNRVRFPAAVRSESSVRARVALQSLKEFPEGVETTWLVTLECQDSEKPCCVAEWITRYYY